MRLQPLRHFLQHQVARRVPHRVVDVLEIIEIDKQQRAMALVTLDPRNFHVEPLGQLVAIRQAGQGIVVSEILDALLGRAQVADIARDGGEELDISAVVAMRDQHLRGQHLFAVERQKGGFIGPHAFLDRLRHAFAENFLPIRRRVKIGQADTADIFVFTNAEQLAARLVDIGDETVEIGDTDQVRGCFQDCRQPLLALARQFLIDNQAPFTHHPARGTRQRRHGFLGFDYIIGGARFHRVDGDLFVAIAGHDDSRAARTGIEQFGAMTVRQLDVGDDQVGAGLADQRFRLLQRRRNHQAAVGIGLESPIDQGRMTRIVLDE